MRPPHRSAHKPTIGFVDHVLGLHVSRITQLDIMCSTTHVRSMSVGLEGFLSLTVGCNSCSAHLCCTGDAPAPAGAGRGRAHTAAGRRVACQSHCATRTSACSAHQPARQQRVGASGPSASLRASSTDAGGHAQRAPHSSAQQCSDASSSAASEPSNFPCRCERDH